MLRLWLSKSILRVRSMSTIATTISLNPTERIFVQHLDDFAQHQNPPVVCRIAGGWVRDKLLALPSHDLDIALSIPSGYTFAVGFVDFLRSRNVATGSVGKVAANPNQSKHLETGTTKILGLECDFVGLRNETYADSRIPNQVQLGTPEEDASRRDLTINALFYNVHTKTVEDYTKKGLDDLQNRIARTPLPPIQTFHDDPLRVLRCIRFAGRFDLVIDDQVVEAMRDDSVKTALRSKVSKERVGIEIAKMMQKSPLRSLQLIHELGLHEVIFECALQVSRDDAIATAQILAHVVSKFATDDMLWLACATSPFRDHVIEGKKDTPAVNWVLAESLKLPNDTQRSVGNLFLGYPLIDTSLTKRSAIGLVLRNSAVQPWLRTIAWAAVMEILPDWKGVYDDRAQAILSKYTGFVDLIKDLKLDNAAEVTPLLNGKEIQNALDIKPSPILSILRDAVLEWQFDNQTGTKEQCVAWMRGMWNGDGRVVWEQAVPRGGEKRKR